MPEVADRAVPRRGQGRTRSCRSRTFGTASTCRTRWRRTASPIWPPSISGFRCTSSAPTNSGSSGRPTRTMTCRFPATRWAPSRVSGSAGNGGPAVRSTPRTSSRSTTSTPTPLSGRSGAARTSMSTAGPVRHHGWGRLSRRPVLPGTANRPPGPSRNAPTGTAAASRRRGLASRWDGWAWPSVRPNSHVLAAMPVETIPGVDLTEMYEFLESQAT